MSEIDQKIKEYLRSYGLPMDRYVSSIRVIGKDEYLRLEVRYTHVETGRELYVGCVSVDDNGNLQPFQVHLQ
jgi:hypothetical protein